MDVVRTDGRVLREDSSAKGSCRHRLNQVLEHQSPVATCLNPRSERDNVRAANDPQDRAPRRRTGNLVVQQPSKEREFIMPSLLGARGGTADPPRAGHAMERRLHCFLPQSSQLTQFARTLRLREQRDQAVSGSEWGIHSLSPPRSAGGVAPLDGALADSGLDGHGTVPSVWVRGFA